MRELVAVLVPGGPEFVRVLREIWDAGDAILPLDTRLPRPMLDHLLRELRPGWVMHSPGDRSRRSGGQRVDDGDALVIATSGSSGAPKGVVHTHASIEASARATNAGIGVDPGSDRILACLPVAHIAGMSAVTRALISGTDLEVHPGFDADSVTEAARRGATITTLVPAALERVDASLFRRIVVGGAAPSRELPANCLQSYGLTETGSAICYDGLPLEGAEIRVIDGEIQARGPMLFRSYRDGADPKDADGWFSTGDLGEIDEQGRLHVHGRRDHMIISGGQNIWPEQVESALRTHPAIEDVAVGARPDQTWGQVVVAIVVGGRDLPSLDELRDWGAKTLPRYALPREVVVSPSVPRSALGKVMRGEVARLAAGNPDHPETSSASGDE